MDFIDKMEYVYGASDIVVSRAGAMAVNEISLLRKNMILSTATFRMLIINIIMLDILVIIMLLY